MDNKESKRISALKTASKNKQLAAKNRIREALDEMDKNNIPITFQAVAKHAQVSKTILYADEEISKEIKHQRHRAPSLQRMLDQQVELKSKDKKILCLTKRVEYLNSEIQRLKSQLEVAYGELYIKDIKS